MRFAMSLFCAASLLVAGCGDANDTVEEANGSDQSMPPATDETPAPVQTETVKLTPDGLSILPKGSKVPAMLAFGASNTEVEKVLTAAIGRPETTSQANDCGLTSTSFKGLTVNFRDDLLVGYFANAPYVPTKTRKEMLDDPLVDLIPGSTIDGEFTMGPKGDAISGVFVGDEVRGLWAGENCIAR